MNTPIAVNPGKYGASPFDYLKAYIDSRSARAMGFANQGRSGSAAPTTADIPSGKYAVWYNTTSTTLSVYYNNNGSLVQVSGSGPASTTLQYMWVVGGANNFATLPGSPTPPIAGATTLVDSGLTGFTVRVYRGGLRQLGVNPASGNTYYTKTTGSNTLTFSQALTAGEEIIVETIPV